MFGIQVATQLEFEKLQGGNFSNKPLLSIVNIFSIIKSAGCVKGKLTVK
jgi:hypothetical protein